MSEKYSVKERSVGRVIANQAVYHRKKDGEEQVQIMEELSLRDRSMTAVTDSVVPKAIYQVICDCLFEEYVVYFVKFKSFRTSIGRNCC